jgi:hypothetical protein
VTSYATERVSESMDPGRPMLSRSSSSRSSSRSDGQMRTGSRHSTGKSAMPIASALGKHVIIAGIDADNAASIRMHERLGVFRVAHFKQVGFKFDRWLDLVFLQRYMDQQ